MSDHPSEEQILAIVAEKVAEQKSIEASDISLDSKFEDLEVDSLDAMEILFELEEELDVDIPDTAARSMRTVADVVEGLGKLVRGEEIELPEPPSVPVESSEARDDDAASGSSPGVAAGR